MLILSHQFISQFLLVALLVSNAILSPSSADCPYPCLPSPTGSYPPPPPPYTPSSPAYGYPPPPPGTPDYSYGYYPPPSGYIYSPPSYSYPAPPPPNPILPWFPFYYRNSPPVGAAPPPRVSFMGAVFVALLTTLLVL